VSSTRWVRIEFVAPSEIYGYVVTAAAIDVIRVKRWR
jgi:hypothetical protein